jgi:sugar/nucleoside kinase (ribokinase family)
LCGIGAGDALTAAFAAGLLRGIPALEAVERGERRRRDRGNATHVQQRDAHTAEIDALLVRSPSA